MTGATASYKPTVLVVDDVAFVRSTLVSILNENGYQVIGEAGNGADAIEQYSRLNPDLVTMDVVMPKMSGIEAARKIVKATPSARIVMISAMGQESLVMEAIHAGARDYLLKPFSSQEILRTLAHVLESATTGIRGDQAAGA